MANKIENRVRATNTSLDTDLLRNSEIRNGEFVEYEEVYAGSYYGTLVSEVERIWAKGNIIIFDIDVKGGVNLTKKVVEYAHQFDVTVEGELGVLAGVEDEVSSDHHTYTNPEEVVDFATRTLLWSKFVSTV